MEFPGVLANDDISLSIKNGEVFALVGENGAGKSTLMNILYGINTPTAGDLYVRGEKVTEFSPKAAIDRGIGMVHQHFMLVPSFTVAQNIVLGREPKQATVLFDNKKAEKLTRELVQEYGLEVDPSAEVRDISVGLQQRVEILKTLYRGADILILDEPTAVLTPQETDELFEVIRRIVREKQITVIIITHKLYEVMAISDRVGVMRQGKLIGVENTKDVDEKKLASMMVGRPVLFDHLEKTGEPGDVAIEVDDLYVADNRGLPAVRGVSLSVRKGEVLGIAAIEGNGQSELLEAITGMRKANSGKVTVCGKDATGKTPGEIRAMGLSHVPEDRLSTGVDKVASVADNLLVGKHRDREYNRFDFRKALILMLMVSTCIAAVIFTIYGLPALQKMEKRPAFWEWFVANITIIFLTVFFGLLLLYGSLVSIRYRKGRSTAERYASELYQKFDIRGAGIHTEVGSMSGGNMQKVVVAREFSFDTPALVISQPTRGVDIGAMEFFHTRIIEKRNEGAAILLSSADLDEVFRLSDRIITLYEGKITGEFKADEITKEEIGLYMTGAGKGAEA